MTAKTHIILNPAANREAAGCAGELLVRWAETRNATLSITSHPGHAVALAREAAEGGCQMVVAAGGDGTVHEVINGLMQMSSSARPMLGIVPLGSGNDFAITAGVPRGTEPALQLLIEGSGQPVDVGRIRRPDGSWEWWNNTVGVGFDAAVNHRTRRIRNLSGFPIYMAATLQTMALQHRPCRMRLRCDGDETVRRILMLTIANGHREGGGFIVAPEARIDNGRLDVLHIGPLSRRSMLRLLPRVLQGTHAGFPQVRLQHATRIDAMFENPLPVHADGEMLSLEGMRRISVELHAGALHVMRPIGVSRCDPPTAGSAANAAHR